MCKFCDVYEDGTYKGMHKFIEVKYPFGKYGNLYISLYLDGNKENGAELWSTGNIDYDTTLFDTFRKINYCPMCGKYIGKEDDQNAG